MIKCFWCLLHFKNDVSLRSRIVVHTRRVGLLANVGRVRGDSQVMTRSFVFTALQHQLTKQNVNTLLLYASHFPLFLTNTHWIGVACFQNLTTLWETKCSVHSRNIVDILLPWRSFWYTGNIIWMISKQNDNIVSKLSYLYVIGLAFLPAYIHNNFMSEWYSLT